jgi:uncharacterized membrane protein
MNVADTERKSGSGSVVSSAANTRLSGTRLIIARAVWLALVIPSIGLFVASLPAYYALIQRACIDPVTCNVAGTLTAKGLQDLPAFGLSVSSYAALLTIFFTIIAATWSGIGFLIFWRRSDEWFALLTALFLVMFNTTYPGFPISALALMYPALDGPITFLSALGLASIVLFLVLFPNGRLVPRWMGLFLLLGIIGAVSTVFPPTSPFNSNNLPWFIGLGNFVVYGAIIFSQIYRYRHVSTRAERQQTKWVVFGIIVVVIGIFVILPICTFFFPTLNQSNTPSSLIFGLAAYPLVLLSIPVSVGVAVLRYRLYDIDVLINRTLVYGTLTALLALVYFGLIFVSQSLLQGMFKQNNDVAIVISTLVIAALFQPLHRRIQWIIDRRFYRRKYDAARTLAQFSATLRNEVDLHQLREGLVAVVEETMQPTYVSLWVREDNHPSKSHINV